jgi:hypothetical protein
MGLDKALSGPATPSGRPNHQLMGYCTVNQKQRLTITLLLILVFLLPCLSGCSSNGDSQQPNLTVTALSAAISSNATAVQGQDSSANSLATAQAKATQSSLEIQATQTALAGSRDEAQLATATIAAPMVAELPFYGLDGSSGHPGWLHDPLTLEISGYQEFAYGNDHMEVTAADFVLAADITWDTQYGSSGCGFMFRSDADEAKPNQYLVIASRFANGRVVFSALADGEIANIHDFYPKDNDRSFDWQNGTTNRLTVIARGPIIEIYTNRVKIGEIDTTQPPKKPPAPPKPAEPLDKSNQDAMAAYQGQLKEYEDILSQSQTSYNTALRNYSERPAVFEDGFLAMIAVSESGRTVCSFDKAWLWILDD